MPLLGSKPVPKDRCSDKRIGISAHLALVDAHDQLFKGETKQDKSALDALTNFLYTKKTQDGSPSSSRITLVIFFPQPTEKKNSRIPPNQSTITTATDQIHRLVATKERPEAVPTWVYGLAAARTAYSRRRKAEGLANTYRAFGCIRLLKSSRGTRL